MILNMFEGGIKKMGLTELLTKIGDDNTTYQNLRRSMKDIKTTKHGSLISFYTNELSPTDIVRGAGKIGLVVWVDADILEDVLNNTKKE